MRSPAPSEHVTTCRSPPTPEVAETTDYPIEAADAILNNNCRSAFLMTRAALPHLQEQQGCIVSAGSEAGYNGTPPFTPYGASKAWMHAFMKGVAVEQAKYGVRANCVCPGPIDTSWPHAETGPMARRGTTEEIATGYAFLASDEASYMTGTLVLVDGGITVAHGNIGEQTPETVRQQPEGVLDLAHQHDE